MEEKEKHLPNLFIGICYNLYMFIHNEKSAKTNHSSLPTGHFFIPNFAFFRSGSAFTCSGRVIPGKYFTFSWDVSAQMGTQKLTPKNPTWPQKTHIKNRLNTHKQGLCSSERIDSQRIFIQVDPRIHQVYPGFILASLPCWRTRGGANDTFHIYKWMTHYSLDPMDSSIENSKNKKTQRRLLWLWAAFLVSVFFLTWCICHIPFNLTILNLPPLMVGKKSHKLALPDVSDLRTINSISTSTSRRFLLKDS